MQLGILINIRVSSHAHNRTNELDDIWYGISQLSW